MASVQIKEAFEKIKSERRTGIVLYLTVGFPDVETTLTLVPALAAAGADIIELGVPFSDPMADGTTIQKASFHALQQGVTLKQCLAICSEFRTMGVTLPLILMGYYNPVISLGIDVFTEAARKAGVNGLIVPDLPPEESTPLRESAERQNMDLVSLLAPTSTERRIRDVCATASGFIYCVSVAGVTGARQDVSADGLSLVQRVRRHTDVPIAVGFGVARREHVEAVGAFADAAIIGSALLNVLDTAPRGEIVNEAVRFVTELRGDKSTPARGAE